LIIQSALHFLAQGETPMTKTTAFRISIALLVLWGGAVLTFWLQEPVPALITLGAVLVAAFVLKAIARDDDEAEGMAGMVTDWQGEKPTAEEFRLRDEAVRLCRISRDWEAVQAGSSEGVAYVHRDRIIWAINRPNAIARGWAQIEE
jgi:hypothetical protein